MAGLHFASGRAIITMDGDLQHPPELIPKLLKEWRSGSAAVFTAAHYGKSASAFRRLTSRLFHHLWAYLADVRVHPGLSGFMLLDRRVVNALLSMKERARFPIGLVQWLGYSNTTVEFDVAPRHSGTTKFSPRGLLTLAAEGISSFSAFPLHIALYIGTVFALLGFVYAGYAVLVATVLREPVPGWASILCAVTIIGGVQLISLGVIGVYVGHIFDEVKGRPLCVVDWSVGVSRVDRPGEAQGLARSWVLVDKSET
jgi:dolichol-phosphate mannosyltransferase